VLVNSENVHWLRNLGRPGKEVWLEDRGPISQENVQGHTTSPSVVDFNADGILDLILGAENGRIYYQRNPNAR
jgi:hypothetical protein